MHKPVKYMEKVVTSPRRSVGSIRALQPHQAKSLQRPSGRTKPLLKSYEKSSAARLARTTDSLCPRCVPEIVSRSSMANCPTRFCSMKSREIKGRSRARRQNPHGEGLPQARPLRRRHVDDPEFSRTRNVFPGRTSSPTTTRSSTTTLLTEVRPRSVLTIDLTNRCNMMCDPASWMPTKSASSTNSPGRHQDDARQRDHHQAAFVRCPFSSRRRAHAVALFPGRSPLC